MCLMPYTYGKSVASTLLKFKGNIQSLWMVWRNQNVIESDSEAKKCTCPHPKKRDKTSIHSQNANWISQWILFAWNLRHSEPNSRRWSLAPVVFALDLAAEYSKSKETPLTNRHNTFSSIFHLYISTFVDRTTGATGLQIAARSTRLLQLCTCRESCYPLGISISLRPKRINIFFDIGHVKQTRQKMTSKMTSKMT